MRFPALLALFVVLPAASASAAACTSGTTSWTNAAGGNWPDAANWSNGVPSRTCDAKITLDGEYQVGMHAPGAARSLTLGGASGAQILISGAGEPLTVGSKGVTVGEFGSLKLINGRIQTSGTVRLDGGRLYGAGTVTAGHGVVNTNGLLGLTANSVLKLVGGYVQDAEAMVRVDVPAADNPDIPGAVEVSGPVLLDGTLRINGPAPTRPAPLTVIKGTAGITGAFSRVALEDQPYAAIYAATSVSIGPVPATPDETAPKLTAAVATPKSFRGLTTVSFKDTEAGKVDISVDRIATQQRVANLVGTAQTGGNHFRLDARPRPKGLGLKPGRYRITMVALDAAGNASTPVSLTVTVRKR